MEKKFRVMITFLVVIFLISGLYIFTNWFSVITGYFKGEDESVKLARCLDVEGAEFYGGSYCAECEGQRDMFGASFSLVNQVDCGRDKEHCPNIREIPAWFIKNEIHYGLKSFDELKELSGCED